MFYDFEPMSESELGVNAGDFIYVLGEFTQGWILARRIKFIDENSYELEDIQGIVPFTYVDWDFKF